MSSSDASDGASSVGGSSGPSSSNSSSQGDAGGRRRDSLSDSDDGAVFISSRSEIVISPRRRVGTSTWDAIEPLLSGAGGAVLRRTERVSSARASSRTRTPSAAKSSSVQSTRAGSTSGSARTARGQPLTSPRRDGRGAKDSSSARTDRHRRRKSSDVDGLDVGASGSTSRGGMGDVRTAVAAAARGDPPAASTGSVGTAVAAGDDGGRHRADVRHEGAGSDGECDDSESSEGAEEEASPRARGGRSRKTSGSKTSVSSSRRERDGAKSGKASRADKHRGAARGREAARRHSGAHSPSSQSSSRSPAPAKSRKPVSFNSEASYGEAVGVLLPSPKEEMEELKQTLKKLASHGEDSGGGHARGGASRSPPPAAASASDTQLHPPHSLEYLQVASAALQPPSPAEQLRLGEFVAQQPFANGTSDRTKSSVAMQKPSTLANGGGSGRSSRHASFDPAALDAKLRGHAGVSNAGSSSRSKSMTAAGNGGGVAVDGARVSLNQKLFGDASGAFMPSSNAAGSGLGMQGVLGMTGAGAGGSAQGSRAVLSALKALQDKIRRLEEERETLMQQLSDERVKARKREAELASSEKKFSYELGQTKESARAAYDAIRAEREELKVELVKTEERRKAAESEIQHFQALMATYADKSDDLHTQLEISESQRTRLETELAHSAAASKSETQELAAKLRTLEHQQDVSQEQIKLLDAQLQRESSNHTETRERLHASEQTVASVSQLNEKLVARVWEVTEVANRATKLNKKLQQQRGSAVSKTTAASRAAATRAAAASGVSSATGSAGLGSRRSGAVGGLSSRGVDTSTARLGTRSSAASGGVPSTGAVAAGKKSVAKKTKRRDPGGAGATPGAANNMELLRVANMGKEIPFLLGTSANQSFSIIGNVQDAIRQCDTTYVTPNTLTGEPIKIPGATTLGSTTGSRRASRVTSSSLGKRTPTARRKVAKTSGAAAVSANILGVPPPPPPPATLLSDRTRGAGGASSAKAENRVKPSSIQVPPPPPAPVSMHINPMQTQILEDLAAALHCAETEFAALNDRYRDIVSRMQAEGSSSASGGSSSGGDTSTQLSNALGPLLDELETKGKQVNLLKQVLQQASNSSINPLRRVVHSPEAIRRKTASLRLLNEYRQLERDARASPSHHYHQYQQHSTSFFSDHEQF